MEGFCPLLGRLLGGGGEGPRRRHVSSTDASELSLSLPMDDMVSSPESWSRLSIIIRRSNSRLDAMIIE